MAARPLGILGETLAAEHLQRAGWSILDRNFRWGRKEIDLVAGRDGVVAFVEVKARGGPGFGHPLDAVTWRKRREIAEVAAAWIERAGRPEWSYRFDAVAVIRGPSGEARLEHIEDAWRL